MQQVRHEERAVDCDVLACADEFLAVHQGCEEGEGTQQGRLRPEPGGEARLWPVRDLAHEEEAEGDGEDDAGKVEASEPEEGVAGYREVEGEEAGDPAEQGKGKQREVPVDSDMRVAGEDEEGEPGQKQDAEDVEDDQKR